MNADSPVGFFDSGVGGLSILDAFKRLCPDEKTVYIADSANCPYGSKPAEEIVRLSRANARKLIADHGCKMVVVACNTATAAAIDVLRREWPDIPFVGIEPAVKPAAFASKTGIVGVLATQGTFNGRLYRETKARFAKDVTVIATVADELVMLVEKYVKVDSPRPKLEEIDEVMAAVRKRIEPILAAGADAIVLGCTHFPHLRRAIENVASGRAIVIDPSDAVARRAKSLIVDLLCQTTASKRMAGLEVQDILKNIKLILI